MSGIIAQSKILGGLQYELILYTTALDYGCNTQLLTIQKNVIRYFLCCTKTMPLIVMTTGEMVGNLCTE